MIDCGEDWRGRLMSIRPAAILLTHAHPDHAWGLKEGAACPVYASAATWQALSGLPICERRVLAPRSVVTIESMTFEAFPVEHSLRCPAMGFRIMAPANLPKGMEWHGVVYIDHMEIRHGPEDMPPGTYPYGL